MKKYYTTLNCLKQAIQPEVVGPLLYKRCIVYIVAKLIGHGPRTSIDVRERGRTTCACECDPTGSHMYVTRLV